MRILTAKEVNFVSGGFDPFNIGYFTIQDGTSGGYQGTGMPQTSGNSIGDVNYEPPTQAEACANATDFMAGGALLGSLGMIIGTGPAGWVAGALGVLGGASWLANDCSSGSDSGGSCTAPSTDGGG